MNILQDFSDTCNPIAKGRVSVVNSEGVDAQAADEAKVSAFQQCQSIATSPNVLDLLEEDLQRCRLAGERDHAKLLFLILCTRFFDRPVSAMIKGPSSGGKSHLLKTVLDFFPATAFESVSGLSEKAIVYWNADLKHKFLVVYEAAGLQGKDGQALLRTLLSEGHIRYTVTEYEPKNDRREAHVYEREGPTGLLLTTTRARLHHEDESRMLSMTVEDTPEQIRRVLCMEASQYELPDWEQPDYEAWHAFHLWLDLREKSVSIPFGEHLAALTKPVHNRIKRDFKHLLTLIKAHALLHQYHRDQDGEGAIVATLKDYEAVRALVSDIVSAGVSASVTQETRETVEAVASLLAGHQAEIANTTFNDPVPQIAVAQWELAEALDLDESAISRRVRVAIDQGYLENKESRHGKPAKLVLNKPLPDDLEVFPTVEELQGTWQPRLH